MNGIIFELEESQNIQGDTWMRKSPIMTHL